MNKIDIAQFDINALTTFIFTTLNNKKTGLVIVPGNYDARRTIFRQYEDIFSYTSLFHFAPATFSIEFWDKPKGFVKFTNSESPKSIMNIVTNSDRKDFDKVYTLERKL